MRKWRGRSPTVHSSTNGRRGAAHFSHLVSRLFEGSPSLLVLNVLDDEELDPAELQRVKQIIEQA